MQGTNKAASGLKASESCLCLSFSWRNNLLEVVWTAGSSLKTHKSRLQVFLLSFTHSLMVVALGTRLRLVVIKFGQFLFLLLHPLKHGKLVQFAHKKISQPITCSSKLTWNTRNWERGFTESLPFAMAQQPTTGSWSLLYVLLASPH